MRLVKTKFLLVFLSLLLWQSHAELIWEKTKLEQKPSLGSKEAVFRFKVSNKSPSSVKISRLLSSCGCTVAELAEKSIAANSSTEILVTMDLKGVRGLKSSTIKVYCNNENTPAQTLTIKVDVASPIQVSPSFINWRKKDQRKAVELKITIHPDFHAKVTKVEFKSSLFKSKLSGKKNSLSLNIQPPSKEVLKNGREKCVIHFETPEGKVIKKNVYLFVY